MSSDRSLFDVDNQKDSEWPELSQDEQQTETNQENPIKGLDQDNERMGNVSKQVQTEISSLEQSNNEQREQQLHLIEYNPPSDIKERKFDVTQLQYEIENLQQNTEQLIIITKNDITQLLYEQVNNFLQDIPLSKVIDLLENQNTPAQAQFNEDQQRVFDIQYQLNHQQYCNECVQVIDVGDYNIEQEQDKNSCEYMDIQFSSQNNQFKEIL